MAFEERFILGFADPDTGEFIPARSTPDGAALASDGPMEFRHFDDGATYDYYAEAAPGTAQATAAWRVSRINKSTGDEEWASSGTFTLTAVDLADVQGHF